MTEIKPNEELKTALRELDEAIAKAALLSDVPGMMTDWVVCFATRSIDAEDDDSHSTGYLTPADQSIPDYRTLGLLDYSREIISADIQKTYLGD